MAGIDVMVPDLDSFMSEYPRPPKRKSGLFIRILSALVMVPVAMFIILQGGIIYNFAVALLTMLILYEWNGICEDRAVNSAFIFQSVFILLLVYGVSQNKFFDLYIYIIPVGLLILVGLYFRIKLHFALLGLLYAGLPAVSLILLRHYSGWIVLWMMIIVWSMDTGAYFAGKNIGGPKMAPRISPNKTWAGLIGGAITAVIAGLVSAHYFNLWGNLGLVAALAAVLALWSQIGDLAESALKRHFNVKDSGTIIPGHGGIMDRVDGVIFAAPAVVLFLYLWEGIIL